MAKDQSIAPSLAPSGRGLSAKPTGGEKLRITSLPPSPYGRHLPHRGRQAGGAGLCPARNIVQNRREGQSPSPTGGLTAARRKTVSPSVALPATPPSQREASGRGGVLPRPKHCAKSAGGVEPLPYTRFCEGTDENRLSLRRPTGDTSLTEGGKREGRGGGAKKGPPVGGPFLSYFARLFRAYLLFSLPK